MKPAPGDQELNFKKVGAIPCWCNTKSTVFHIRSALYGGTDKQSSGDENSMMIKMMAITLPAAIGIYSYYTVKENIIGAPKLR